MTATRGVSTSAKHPNLRLYDNNVPIRKMIKSYADPLPLRPEPEDQQASETS